MTSATDSNDLFADPFFAHVIVGINAALERTDLVLMLLLADSERGRERLERVLRSRRADGLLLLALHGEDPLHRLAQLRPAVTSLAAEDIASETLAMRPYKRHRSRARVDGASPRPGAET